jgi:hypothetical protein
MRAGFKIVVLVQPFCKVVCRANIQCRIGAFEDIDIKRHISSISPENDILESMKKHLSHIRLWLKYHSRTRIFLIIILTVLCIVEIQALGREVRDERAARMRESEVHVLRDHIDIDDVESWMTFSYLNTVFKLPPEYLKNVLSVESPRYPDIHIGGYARVYKLDPDLLVKNIKQAIRDYK